MAVVARELAGFVGGFFRSRDFERGLWRAEIVASREVGVSKGPGEGGIAEGSGGRDVGLGRVRRGASRRGSTCLRKVEKTSGTSEGLW